MACLAVRQDAPLAAHRKLLRLCDDPRTGLHHIGCCLLCVPVIVRQSMLTPACAAGVADTLSSMLVIRCVQHVAACYLHVAACCLHVAACSCMLHRVLACCIVFFCMLQCFVRMCCEHSHFTITGSTRARAMRTSTTRSASSLSWHRSVRRNTIVRSLSVLTPQYR